MKWVAKFVTFVEFDIDERDECRDMCDTIEEYVDQHVNKIVGVASCSTEFRDFEDEDADGGDRERSVKA